MSYYGAFSGFLGVASAFKWGLVAISILAATGFGYAGCQKLINSGYQQAEADRLEDIAQKNLERQERLTESHRQIKNTEAEWREKAKLAEEQAREAQEEWQEQARVAEAEWQQKMDAAEDRAQTAEQALTFNQAQQQVETKKCQPGCIME